MANMHAAIGIKVNNNDCFKHCDLSEFMDPDIAGLSVGSLLQTMKDMKDMKDLRSTSCPANSSLS